MDATAPRVTDAAEPPSSGPAAIHLAHETAPRPRPATRCSMVLLEVAGQVYRVEFWPDRIWTLMPEAIRPGAIRAHSDDGWFLISAVAEFLASLPPLG